LKLNFIDNKQILSETEKLLILLRHELLCNFLLSKSQQQNQYSNYIRG